MIPYQETPTAPNRRMPFRNDSGESIPAYAAMRITGTVTVAGQTVLTVAKPNTTFQRVFAVNLGTPVANGLYGACTIGGPCYVLYNTSSGTPAVGESWGLKHSQWTLEENRPGVTILAGNLGSGSTARTWCLPEPVNSLIGKVVTSAIAVGGSGTIDVWMGAAGSEADTTMDVTVRDFLMKSGSASIAVGKKVAATWINGTWYVTAAECA